MKDSLVIIPTYNEKENIELILKAVFSLPVDFDVLVIDDNSPDGTANLVEKLQVSLMHTSASGRLHLMKRKGKLGLGTAYIEGFRYGLKKGYTYMLEMDADFSHDPKDLVRLYTACVEEEADVCVGSRYITGVNVVNWPLSRVLLSYGASWYVRMVTGINIKDTTAGFVCWHRNVLEKIDLDRIKFIGYAFQIEMKYLAVQLGFKVREIPIIFTDRTRGQSKMSKGIIKEALFGVIQLKIASIFGRLPIQKKPTNQT